MRQAKLNLAVDLTIKLCSFDEPQMEDLSAVSDWILMMQHGNGGDKDNTATPVTA